MFNRRNRTRELLADKAFSGVCEFWVAAPNRSDNPELFVATVCRLYEIALQDPHAPHLERGLAWDLAEALMVPDKGPGPSHDEGSLYRRVPAVVARLKASGDLHRPGPPRSYPF